MAMRKLLNRLYRTTFMPPRFDIILARGLYLTYDGYRTGDHAYEAQKLRRIAWEKHDKKKTEASAS